MINQSVYTFFLDTLYIYIYIYIYRERERVRESALSVTVIFVRNKCVTQVQNLDEAFSILLHANAVVKKSINTFVQLQSMGKQ